MLDPEVREQIAGHLRLLRHPVQLAVALDDSEASRAVAELVEELAELSPMLTVERAWHSRRPSFAIVRTGSDVVLRFAGPPTGDALSALVLGVLHVGGHPPRVDESTAERVRALQIPVELETWFATSCRSCGDTLHAFGVISVLNPQVLHTAVNGACFRDEADARGITSVPRVFVNGELLTQGRLDVVQAIEVLERLEGLDG